MNEIKFCKDCLHYNPPHHNVAPTCSVHDDVVVGGYKKESCYNERKPLGLNSDRCGPSGRLFEAKT